MNRGGWLIILCLISASATLFSVKCSPFNREQLTQLEAKLCAGKSLIIVTDLHDVMFKRLGHCGDVSRACALKGAFFPFLGRVCKFGSLFVKHALTGSKRPHIEQYAFSPVSDEEQKEKLLEVISPFEPDAQMFDFFKYVVHPVTFENVHVYAGSNVGPESYAFMKTRYSQECVLFKGACIAGPVDGYLQKNDPRFYKRLFEMIAGSEESWPDVIWFIDDRMKNIEMAQQVFKDYVECDDKVLLGYVFTNTQQFKDDVTQYTDLVLQDCV